MVGFDGSAGLVIEFPAGELKTPGMLSITLIDVWGSILVELSCISGNELNAPPDSLMGFKPEPSPLGLGDARIESMILNFRRFLC